MQDNLNNTIRSMAEAMVFCDPEDLVRLSDLFAQLGTVAEALEAEENDNENAAAVLPLLQHTSSLVEALVLRQVGDASSTYAEILSCIEAVQGVVCEGLSLSQFDLNWKPEAPNTANDGDESPASPVATEDAPKASEEQASPASGDTPVSEPAPAAPAKAAAKNDGPKLQLEDQAFTGDIELATVFIGESREHLDAADAELLKLEEDAKNQEALNAVFRAFHTIKGVAGCINAKQVMELAHESETVLDLARNDALDLSGPAVDIIFTVVDAFKELVTTVEEAISTGVLTFNPKVPPLVHSLQAIARGEGLPDQATAPKPAPKPAATDSPDDTDAAKPEMAQKAKASDKAAANAAVNKLTETVRVDAGRLDKLIDAIGELVIAEAMVTQVDNWALAEEGHGLSRKLRHLDKITRELQELAMSMRMVQVRSTFQRMARLARDVSKKLNKPIHFVCSGEETELDKNVVDAISDPIVHMVRNAIDHGIEPDAASREAAGKPEAGRIDLRAYHKGGSIYIEIEDDGRGLARDKIIAKALERGLISSGEGLSDSEVFGLVFEPGFSTAAQVTDVSGRGVGMDVVKRNIQALRGKIEVHSTEGKGSIFSIRLPLTLAIIEGMVLRLGKERFIMPTMSIVRMIRPGEEDIDTVFGKSEMLRVGGDVIPLYRTGHLLGVKNTIQNPMEAAVVVVEHGKKNVAFLVDELVGQQQIVIKPLGPMLKQYPGFSGGAIMSDGRVGLIIDVDSIVGLVGNKPQTVAA